jgi:hypothetical protein
MNYAKALPRDTGGEPMHDYPSPVKALVTTSTENRVASSVINIDPAATQIEISSFGGQGTVIRWVPTTETAAVSPFASVIASGLGANFDHHIQTGTVRRFVIPQETRGQATGQAGSVNGLYQRLAWINGGITAASILATQY